MQDQIMTNELHAKEREDAERERQELAKFAAKQTGREMRSRGFGQDQASKMSAEAESGTSKVVAWDLADH